MKATQASTSSITSLTPPILNNWTREEIFEYFKNGWELNDLLFKSIIDDEVFYTNPDPLRNPLIFYLGHTAAFCINKLKAVGLIENGINEHFEKIFEIGVDPETEDDLESNLTEMVWPAVQEVWKYREDVFNLIKKLILHTTILLPITWESPLWGLIMGIEHDRIHFETSTMLIRQVPIEKLKTPSNWNYSEMNIQETQNEMIRVEGATVHLGKDQDHPTYGWDNEYGELTVKVDPFSASKYQITNKEYYEFVKCGAYNEKKYWGEHAWEWKIAHNNLFPKFWVKEGDAYKYRALFDNLEMPWDWPVEVNHYEAMAYCRWKGNGTRLLTEAEWNLISDLPNAKENPKDDLMYRKDINLNLTHGSPSSVGSLAGSFNKKGFADTSGNVWEWLHDDFYPLPGFKTHGLYKNFSITFFDTFHAMIIGGSWASTGTSASQYYRLWFRRYFYQHAGFRIAQ